MILLRWKIVFADLDQRNLSQEVGSIDQDHLLQLSSVEVGNLKNQPCPHGVSRQRKRRFATVICDSN